MVFSQTEQFIVWLRNTTPGRLTLLPATTQQPWRLLNGDTPLADIALPPAVDAGTLLAAVQAAAAAHGWEVQACGACACWRALDTDPTGSIGVCSWPALEPSVGSSGHQSALAAPCMQFDATTAGAVPPPATTVSPVAAVAGTGRSWWRLRRSKQSTTASGRQAQEIVERSGKRPGTIPCLACPGRMANLGAQKCRTHEGDERTFSVWRCRQCLGYYLNDWIDKWVRTDALEVVDTYYRLAPQEALTCLGMIEEVSLKRMTAADLQRWADSFVAKRVAVRSEVRRAR